MALRQRSPRDHLDLQSPAWLTVFCPREALAPAHPLGQGIIERQITSCAKLVSASHELLVLVWFVEELTPLALGTNADRRFAQSIIYDCCNEVAVIVERTLSWKFDSTDHRNLSKSRNELYLLLGAETE